MSFLSALKKNALSPPLIIVIINAFLLVFCFISIFPGLWGAWQTPEYSHGPLIPLVAFMIGWNALAQKKPPAAGSMGGGALFLIGALLLWISQLSAFEPLADYGFFLGLVGWFLASFGQRVTRAVAPALVYLLFAVPLPRLIFVGLSAELQLVSSTLGVWILHLLNVSVFQEGNVIDLGAFQLQVLEACNGLRYLFPLMSFGFLVAYLFDDLLWKRIVVFLSTIPISIGMNALRIAVIGLTVDEWGPKMAEGLLHDIEGWVVFSLCLLLLFAEVALLHVVGGKKPGAGRLRYDMIGPPRDSYRLDPTKGFKSSVAFLAIAVSMTLLVHAGVNEHRQEIRPQAPAFSSFPLQIGGWHGTPDTLKPDILKELRLTDYWIADYARPQESPVNLYIAYYDSQRIGTSIHSPSNCLPGNGWQLESSDEIGLTLGGKTVPVIRTLIRKGADTSLIYYWFDERGRALIDQYEAKWYLLLDSIFMHRTDGALIRLVTPLPSGQSPAEGDQRLQSFLDAAYPLVQAYIPGPTLSPSLGSK